MHTLSFRPEIYDDVQNGYLWYESKRTGLGEDFLLMLEESYARISGTPELYQTVYKNVQRKLIRRFPYSIFFIQQNDTIAVLAVLHTRQAPHVWQKRTENNM
jgi:plasmid stabilization system protein ParE